MKRFKFVGMVALFAVLSSFGLGEKCHGHNEVDWGHYGVGDLFLRPTVSEENLNLLGLRNAASIENLNFLGTLIVEFRGAINGNVALTPMDYYQDGILDQRDAYAWLYNANIVMNSPTFGNGRVPHLSIPPGDINFDDKLDGTDYLAWNAHKFGSTATSSTPYTDYDINLDGIVDGEDFAIWQFEYAHYQGQE